MQFWKYEPKYRDICNYISCNDEISLCTKYETTTSTSVHVLKGGARLNQGHDSVYDGSVDTTYS